MRGFLVILLLTAGVRGKRRSARDWSSVNFDEVESAWEEGDDAIELKTEDQMEYERLMRRKADVGAPDPQSPETARHHNAQAGPTMMFAKVDVSSDPKLSRSDLEAQARTWSDQLFLGGLRVTTYVIEDDTVLVTQQHGWEGSETRDFLLEQERVKYVEWDSKKYYRADKKGKRKRSKGKKKKKKKKRPRNAKGEL
eukprot:g532.t1